MAQRSKPFIDLEVKGKKPADVIRDMGNDMTRAMKIAAEKTAQELRDSLEFAVGRWEGGEVGWTGALYNSIEARRVEYSSSSEDYQVVPWGIVMWNYGWELDSKSGRHFIHPGTKLATWASAHELYGIKAGPQSKAWEGKSVIVRPHPFIDQGTANYQTHLENATQNG